MKHTEASRQYQLEVEHERRAHRFFDGVLSGQDEVDDAVLDTEHARSKLLDLMVEAARNESGERPLSRRRDLYTRVVSAVCLALGAANAIIALIGGTSWNVIAIVICLIGAAFEWWAIPTWTYSRGDTDWQEWP